MEFSRQEYRIGQPFPSPEDLPNPGIEPRSPALLADSLLSEPSGKPLVWMKEISNLSDVMATVELKPDLLTLESFPSPPPLPTL